MSIRVRDTASSHQFSMDLYFAIKRKLKIHVIWICQCLISENHFHHRHFLILFIFFSYSRIPLVKSIWTLRCREPESKFSTISSAFYSGDSQFLVALMSVSLHILSIMSSEAWKSSFEIKITHYFSCHRCCWHPGEDLLHNPGPAWPPEVPGAARHGPQAQHWVSRPVWWRHRYGHRVVGGYRVEGVHQSHKVPRVTQINHSMKNIIK